jgi:hypothetical protein
MYIVVSDILARSNWHTDISRSGSVASSEGGTYLAKNTGKEGFECGKTGCEDADVHFYLLWDCQYFGVGSS